VEVLREMKAEGVAAASDMRRVTDGDMEELATRLTQNGEMGPELITTISDLRERLKSRFDSTRNWSPRGNWDGSGAGERKTKRRTDTSPSFESISGSHQ
jgi:hypothetical protein